MDEWYQHYAELVAGDAEGRRREPIEQLIYHVRDPLLSMRREGWPGCGVHSVDDGRLHLCLLADNCS